MSTDVAPTTEEITLTIDGVEVNVPKGSLIIRAAEKLGINIPRFCDHPLLDPMGACRQCLVEIPDAGNGRGMPKPQAACTTEVAPGMQVTTQVTSPVAEKAQRGVLEFLLINHPLDCPVCDKGGECPLQNQALSHGPGESRFRDLKRTFPKPIPLSAQILLDRERCVLCARCTRFSEQISGDPFIALAERGALQQVGEFAAEPYDSYFSGNVVQICPVGALTSADYRFQARPFDLVSTPSTCEHCAAGCALRVDHRHFQVKRRLAGVDMAVNEEWNCDKGRFGFHYGRQADRLSNPLVREGNVLRPASWAEAIDVAVRGLQAAGSSVGVLTGGRLTLENAYAYSKFARTVLGTNDIDFRSRAYGAEEADFLAARVAGSGMGVTYEDLSKASTVVCVGFEPEDESPIVFLRLRRAFRKNKTKIVTVAPFLSNGSRKLGATLVPAVPGTEASVLESLGELDAGSVILVGERVGLAPGALDAAARLAERSGAKLAWVPRRAGDRGAIEAGCLPNLLPGGRPLSDASARVDVAAAWGAASLPTTPGRDAEAILAGAVDGSVKALLVAGVEARDFANPDAVRLAAESAGFVVAIETRQSEITDRADVVFPVALIEDQAGTFVNWEGRERSFGVVVKLNTTPVTDLRALVMLADAMGADLGFRTHQGAKAEFDELGAWEGARAEATHAPASAADGPADGLVLATWRLALDDAMALDGSGALLETAPRACLRVSPATAERLALGAVATIRTDAGQLTLPVVVTDPMADDVVWVPANSAGSCVSEALRVTAGTRVSVTNEGDVR